MGGNALKGHEVCRLTADEYKVVSKEVLEKLQARFPKYMFSIIPSYKNKPDFGDLDILVTDYQPELFDGCREALNAVAEVRNKGVSSFGYRLDDGRIVQVDIIKTQTIDWSYVYFGYNDLGNLMGRIAKMLGFRYGHDGLWYTLYSPDNDTQVIEDILVTRDLYLGFRIIGYDYRRWFQNHREGFASMQDVYDYATTTDYFDPRAFLLENRPHHERIRDKKRKSYVGFLEWIKVEFAEELAGPAWDDETKARVRKEHLQYVFHLAPAFKFNCEELLAAHAKTKKARENFTADLVREVTGVQGKQIRIVIEAFKSQLKSIGFDDFEQWCIDSGKATVVDYFMKWWEVASVNDGVMIKELDFHRRAMEEGKAKSVNKKQYRKET